MSENPSGLITEASPGIGAAYADRFARREYSLVLVARCRRCPSSDLTMPVELASVEARLRNDRRIGILVNNAEVSIGGIRISQRPKGRSS
ncbi:hypothetical protein [Mesorhizobium sp. WSM3876]|uniref:hypothetical protein n=1 Tax=Mesorhizobium sp. WSM3876 TaxID=422277 RepID=UPI0011409AFB